MSNLDALISELYECKNKIRDFPRGHPPAKKALLSQKNELLVRIQRELNNISKKKREEIRSKLYEELGVMI